jgi:hypothetical protein
MPSDSSITRGSIFFATCPVYAALCVRFQIPRRPIPHAYPSTHLSFEATSFEGARTTWPHAERCTRASPRRLVQYVAAVAALRLRQAAASNRQAPSASLSRSSIHPSLISWSTACSSQPRLVHRTDRPRPASTPPGCPFPAKEVQLWRSGAASPLRPSFLSAGRGASDSGPRHTQPPRVCGELHCDVPLV